MSHENPCGTFNETVNTTWDKIKDLFGIVGAISLIILIYKVISTTAKAKSIFGIVIDFLGVNAAAGFWIFAILVYLLTIYIFFRLWYDECIAEQKGESRCASGVVEAVRGEDLGVLLNASHPSIDVVIKLRFWFIVQTGADHVFCSDAGSPILRVFFKSSRICAVKGGAVIGAAILGAVGVVLGVAAAIAIGGCATVILCALALLLAALIIVAAAVAGAFAGAAIAAGTTDEDPASYDSGDTIQIRDYVSVTGPTTKNMNFQGAIVQVFNDESALMGRSANSPSFTHDEPDANIPDNMDVCLT